MSFTIGCSWLQPIRLHHDPSEKDLPTPSLLRPPQGLNSTIEIKWTACDVSSHTPQVTSATPPRRFRNRNRERLNADNPVSTGAAASKERSAATATGYRNGAKILKTIFKGFDEDSSSPATAAVVKRTNASVATVGRQHRRDSNFRRRKNNRAAASAATAKSIIATVATVSAYGAKASGSRGTAINRVGQGGQP